MRISATDGKQIFAYGNIIACDLRGLAHMKQKLIMPTVWAHLGFNPKCALFSFGSSKSKK